MVDDVKHIDALWVSHLPLFKVFLANTILLNWNVVALSRSILMRIYPRWHPPPHGALKLNFDGSASGNPCMAGVGGVNRNEDGIIIMSYSRLAVGVQSTKQNYLS
eukprot:TRINITY_DN13898_c0_g1_i11.p1 TRINITY_DN13898_c0_g1~~TRINITY_DN13898_c0_g1_i11.p1  ORF type:complete len:105 (-),score=14.19 TRINITY_DN13898_c0_g1_i11:172-486(-)